MSPPQEPAPEGSRTHWSRILGRDYDYLVRRFWEPLHGYLARRMGSPGEAEDVTQEVFLLFLEKDLLGRPRPEGGPFRPFLFHVAQQYLIDRKRAAGAAKRGAGRKVSLEAMGGAAPGRDDPEDEFDRGWYLSVLRRAKESVREHYEKLGRPEAHQAFRLFYFPEGKRPSHEEVAAATGLSPGQVRNAVHRAKAAYREAVLAAIREYASTQEEIDAELEGLSRFLERHGDLDGAASGAWRDE